MTRSLPLHLGICVLTLLAGAPGWVSGQMEMREVTAIHFRGNQEFSDAALSAAIITRETECRSFILFPLCLAGAEFALDPFILSEREFRRDHARIRVFYYLRGYREAQVDTTLVRTPDQVEITFSIEEGRPVRVASLAFEGVEDLPDPGALEDLPIQEGEPLSVVALDATRDTLESRLRNQGFAHAAVFRAYDLSSDAPYDAHVTLTVSPGPLTYFGPIEVDIQAPGRLEPEVEERVVRRMLPFREGDLYREELRFSAQRNLYSLDLFRFVNLVPDSMPVVDSILPITVELEEGDIHQVRVGGGLSNAECVNLEARWSSRNFRGGARRLQITARMSNVLAKSLSGGFPCPEAGTGDYGDLMGSLAVDFTQPWFFSPRNSLTLGIFADRQSLPGLFVQEALGSSLGLTHSPTASALAGVFFRPQLSRLDAAQVFFCSSYLICDTEEIRKLQESNWLSPVGTSLSVDRRNQVLNPTRGYSALLDLEHATKWTGSDFRYTRVISEATWHFQGEGRLVLATKVRGGWVWAGGFQGLGGTDRGGVILHPEKRFFAGGANSVRGYGQNRLGPRILYLENVEELGNSDSASGNAAPCTAEQIMDRSCDAGSLPESAFLSRPRGGTRLLEGSLEVRFPLEDRFWEGATFLDFGQVWDEGESPALTDLEFSPGMGVRYFSPIGPIRVDVAYRFGGAEPLPVVTQAIEPFDPSKHTEEQRLAGDLRDYAAPGDLVVLEPPVLRGGGISTWDLKRFQLHLSIGQAF